MSEVAEFMLHGAATITPRKLQELLKQLPLLKAEFTQIEAPDYPHLVDQLEFLADAVEDFAEGDDADLPYCAAAAAAFALMYAHKTVNLIPDHHPDLGRADDSSVVRAVLIQYERAFADYAERHKIAWTSVTSKP
jgi:uncharacterized membrane protein YkvA (DUF1232 family)